MKDLSDVSCHKIAFSDKTGKSVINSNNFPPTNSLLETITPGAAFHWKRSLFETFSREEVVTNTVDKFCEDNGIDHIDIMKIDVQGMEYRVLEGARKMLYDQKISLIYFEVITVPTYIGQRSLKDYFNLLDSLGYEFINFYNPISNKKRLLQADILFISSDFSKSKNS